MNNIFIQWRTFETLQKIQRKLFDNSCFEFQVYPNHEMFRVCCINSKHHSQIKNVIQRCIQNIFSKTRLNKLSKQSYFQNIKTKIKKPKNRNKTYKNE